MWFYKEDEHSCITSLVQVGKLHYFDQRPYQFKLARNLIFGRAFKCFVRSRILELPYAIERDLIWLVLLLFWKTSVATTQGLLLHAYSLGLKHNACQNFSYFSDMAMLKQSRTIVSIGKACCMD